MDFDVANYEDDELLELLGITSERPTAEEVRQACQEKLHRHANNIFFTDFFRGVYSRFFPVRIEGFAPFLSTTEDGNGDDQEDKEPASEDTNSTQQRRETSLVNEERQPAADAYVVPVKQDTLNPSLKNTFERFVNLDSQFRAYTNGTQSSSTAYTCTLSDTLKNTTALFLHSFQIPYSWYTIDPAYGNTCFWVLWPSGTSVSPVAVAVSIPAGNYSADAFVQQLTSSLAAAGFSNPDTNTDFVTYSATQGILTLSLFGALWTDPEGDGSPLQVSESTRLVFYDFSATLRCAIHCTNNTNHFFNNTLGWMMGFRFPNVAVDPAGNRASAILDLNGPKYLIISVDDFNQNHVNNSMVSITRPETRVRLPSYFTPTNPHICLRAEVERSNLLDLMGGVAATAASNDQTLNAQNGLFEPGDITGSYVRTGEAQNGLVIGGKYQHEYMSTRVDLPSAPRTLTNAQLATINSIQRSNNDLSNYLVRAPTSADILAIVPVKTSAGVPTGSLLVEFSGSLQNNRRSYFGPVDIDRLRVKLMDDKGNQLNLNGTDWCITLVAECLYQY